MLKISKDLFTSWNDAGLLYCHWKSNEHLLPGLDGDTDLDVLLSRDNQAEGEAILRKLDFLQCKSQYGARFPNVDDWIGFDGDTGKLIHLHLHYQIVTGHKGLKEYTLPWTDRALSTRVYNEEYGVYTMEPNLELVTLYTRIGLKASFVEVLRCYRGAFGLSNDTHREITWLKDRVNMGEVRHLLDAYFNSSADEMHALINKDNIDADSYKKIINITERTFSNNRRFSSFVRLREVSIFIYLKYLIKITKKIKTVVVKKVVKSEKGITVAFLGQDGAGKTTVTNDLLKWLNWKMDVRYVYLGSGDNYRSWKKYIASFLPTKGLIKYVRGLMQLWMLKDVAKDAYSNVLNAEKLITKGVVVFYDRFPQIDYVGICDGPKVRKKLDKYFGNSPLAKLFVPLAKKEERCLNDVVKHSPSIVFKLILPPEESIRRKPHENLEGIKRKHEIIKSLDFKGSVVYTIDATLPYNEELLMIKKIIWQHIH